MPDPIPLTEAPQLERRPVAGKGQGVFTLTPLARGQRLLTMQGIVLPTNALTDDMLALQIGADLWLCSDGSRIDDRINHSCEPNVGFVDGSPTLYALRDIAVGEEIAFDYSTSLSEPGWSLECRCGSPRCRGIIRPWGELTPAERERLQEVALNYLRER